MMNEPGPSVTAAAAELELRFESLKRKLEEQLAFEAILNEISSRFINIPADQVHLAIEDTQRMLCEALDLDRSSLFQCSDETESTLLLTHMYQRPGLSYPLEKRKDQGAHAESYWTQTASPVDDVKIDAKDMFPWFYDRARRGETAIVPDVQALQSERDREILAAFGTRSAVVVPLSIGGKCLGMLTFACVRQCRDWPAGLVKRFEFLASVYSNALARARGDQSLRDSEERYRKLFEAESDAILLMDWESGEFLDSNAAAHKMYGYSSQEFLDLRYRDLSFEQETPAANAPAIQNRTSTVWHRRKSGECFAVEMSASFVDHLGRKSLVMAVRDISERYATHKQLEQSEEKFRQIAENIREVFYVCDARRGRVEYVSPVYEEVSGRSAQALYENAASLFEAVHPEDRERVRTSALNAASGEITSVEYRVVRPDGSIRWVWNRAFPILDMGGVTRITGLVEDITERKLAEVALHQSLAEIKELKDRLQAETEYLRSEIKVTQAFGEIVGQSPPIRRVLHQVEQVAPVDCPVLITGETGTGKELIARAIHRLSPRKDRAMVKVNCAALPSALVESELFGRERGAFTGAMTTQAGRFEIADGSTIFLDEIGELTPEIQVKLLRVLQEGEFERLGSPRVRKVNVRVLAATNRDLAQEVPKGRFRQDLFYRLSVFPIKVPALRERAEDIPALVTAFVSEFASRMNKRITKLPRRTMTMLQGYSWPGNIRQLRNVLEHAVILTTDDVLRVTPVTEQAAESTAQPTTLADSEREHILRIFERTGGRIKGPRGAAQLLGLNPATLYSRMRKLGISNRPQKS